MENLKISRIKESGNIENLKISRIKEVGRRFIYIGLLSLVSIGLSLIMYFHVSNLNIKEYTKWTYYKDGSSMSQFIPAPDFKAIYTSYAFVFGIILLILLINLFRAGFVLINCDNDDNYWL